uniref:Uncharacterized protein n=1 Tax=Solanum tuberosum TaxID=4113 RepID=M1D3X8_SOLTU
MDSTTNNSNTDLRESENTISKYKRREHIIKEEVLPSSGQRVGTKTSRRRSFHHTKLQQTATDGNLKAKTPELLSLSVHFYVF